MPETRVLLITASTGIGAATARLAARAGDRLFAVSRTPDHGAVLADEIREGGGTCEHAAADLARADQARAVVRRCIDVFGRIDGLFNVAGISGSRFGDGPIHQCTEEGWDTVLATNLKSMYLVCQAVITQMLAQPIGPSGLRGTVLNMASVLGVSPFPKHFTTHAYAASKGAIVGMSRSMAGYYAPHKIRVNVIAPGLTQTPMAGRAVNDDQIIDAMKDKQPLLDGAIEPEDVARSALFLLGDDSRAVTGDTLVVDGGWCVSP